MDYLKHFEKQLEKAKPCDGEYIGTADNTVSDEVIAQKIKEYADHKGDVKLFFMLEDTSNYPALKIQMLSVWKSEVNYIFEKYEYVRHAIDTPLFRERQ